MFFKKKKEFIDIRLIQYQLKVVHMVNNNPYEIKVILDKRPDIYYDYDNNSIEWNVEGEIEEGCIRNVVTYSLLKV